MIPALPAGRAPPAHALRRAGWALLVWALAVSPAAAQHRQPDTVISVDVDVLGGALSYARASGPGRYRGVQAGLGGAFFNRMLVSGRHFADEDGPSYEPRRGRPRVMAGMFSEGSSAREFGVYLVPLSGRLSFGW